MQDKLKIGQVTGVHGVRGEMKVRPFTDDPAQFLTHKQIIMDDKVWAVKSARLHKGTVLLALSGIEDRTAAEQHRSAEIFITREAAGEPEADEFYITDLIGMAVVSPDGAPIGTVTDIVQTCGSVDNFVIKTPERALMVPARKAFFDIDLNAGVITADIPQDYYVL